jgi:Rho GTPase-activating protein 39
MLAVEYINAGLQGNESLRTEMYVQVMKQLSSNPTSASTDKGWEMMVLLLSSFPPPPPIENHVLTFIREKVLESSSSICSPPFRMFPS